MTRCLVVIGRGAVGEPLAEALSESGFEVDLCAKSADVTRALNENLPDVLMVDLHDHLGLRMLAFAESLRLRVPVLALREKLEWSRPLAFPLSPFLRIYSLSSGAHEWRSQIDEAAGSAAKVNAGSMFHWTDYVQLAVLSELSVAMHGRLEDRGDVHVEIVGGDVWNAYVGEVEGEDALVEALTGSPREINVNLLLSVPSGRQIRRPGWNLLDECARRISPSDHLPADDGSSLGTRPLSLEEIRQMLKDEVEVPLEEEKPETFDELLERGFGAALARDYEGAAEAFERALALRPDDTRVKFNLKKVRQRLEERS